MKNVVALARKYSFKIGWNYQAMRHWRDCCWFDVFWQVGSPITTCKMCGKAFEPYGGSWSVFGGWFCWSCLMD